MGSSAVDRILARELGRLGGLGAALVARLLPNDVGHEALQVSLPVAEVAERVEGVLAQMGTPLSCDDPQLEGTLCAIVGTGHLRLNPAIVCVWVDPAGAGGSLLSVHGVAKEGLIKQRGGQQAARELAERLRDALSAVEGGTSPEAWQT